MSIAREEGEIREALSSRLLFLLLLMKNPFFFAILWEFVFDSQRVISWGCVGYGNEFLWNSKKWLKPLIGCVENENCERKLAFGSDSWIFIQVYIFLRLWAVCPRNSLIKKRSNLRLKLYLLSQRNLRKREDHREIPFDWSSRHVFISKVIAKRV